MCDLLTAPYAARILVADTGVSHQVAETKMKTRLIPTRPSHAINGCHKRRKFFGR